MKKIILLSMLMFLFITVSTSQITVKINGKAITEGQEISGASIEKMEVQFSSAKKLKRYDFGRTYLQINMTDTKGSYYAKFYLIKEGEAAITDFLQGVNKPHLVYNKSDGNSAFEFQASRSDMFKFSDVLKAADIDLNALKLNVKVSLYFRDKVGYQKYGDPVYLANELNFVINNTNPDGFIHVASSPFKIKPEDVEKSNYKGANVYKNGPAVLEPFTTDPVVNYVYLQLEGEHEYKTTDFKFVDIKEKTQDEAIAIFKKDFESYIKIMSNRFNKKALKKLPVMPDPTQHQYSNLISSTSYTISAPLFDKEENDSWENEEAWKPFESGIFKGYKFSSVFRYSDGKTPPKNRAYYGYAVVYVVKHPTDPKKIIVMYCKEKNENSSPEKVKKVEELNDKFLSILKL